MSSQRPPSGLDGALARLLRAVPRADMAVLSITAPHPAVLARTDERAQLLDAAQLRDDEGPCVAVARSQRAVLADLNQIRTYWLEFARRARELRVHSLLVVPLRTGLDARGALSLYAGCSHAFDDSDEEVLRRCAPELAVRPPTKEESWNPTAPPWSSRRTNDGTSCCAPSRT